MSIARRVQRKYVVMHAGPGAIQQVDQFIGIAFQDEVIQFKLIAPMTDENRDPTRFRTGIGPTDGHVAEANVPVRLRRIGKQRGRRIDGRARHAYDRVSSSSAPDLDVRRNRDTHAGSGQVSTLPARNGAGVVGSRRNVHFAGVRRAVANRSLNLLDDGCAGKLGGVPCAGDRLRLRKARLKQHCGG